MSSPQRAVAEPPSFGHHLARTLPFMLLCGIVGPIFLFIYVASGSSDLIGWMFWWGLVITVLDVALAVTMAAVRTRAGRRTHRLQRAGRRGVAEILSLEQTGVRINDQPLLSIKVRITGPDLAGFEAERRAVVADIQLPLLYAGPVPVLVDPETGEWDFDWSAARTAAGRGGRPSPGAAGDQRPVADRLAELDDLFRQDLLSREEYDAARARILGEL